MSATRRRCSCLECLQFDLDGVWIPEHQDCFCGLCSACIKRSQLVSSFYGRGYSTAIILHHFGVKEVNNA